MMGGGGRLVDAKSELSKRLRMVFPLDWIGWITTFGLLSSASSSDYDVRLGCFIFERI
jgi:hypothetical protein